VTVKIEGMLETSQVVRLSPGQSQEIGFTLSPGKPGIYQVEIGDLQGSFTVEGIPAPTPTPPSLAPEPEAVGYSWLIIVLSVAAVAVLASATIAVRRRLQSAPELAVGRFGRYVRTTLRVPAIERPLKPAVRPADISAFRIGNMRIDSERVRLGETVTIVAEAACIARVRSSTSLVLKVAGIVEAVKEITLGPGHSQKVAFTILKDKPGVYDVSLEDLTGSFVVEQTTELPPTPPSPPPTAEEGGFRRLIASISDVFASFGSFFASIRERMVITSASLFTDMGERMAALGVVFAGMRVRVVIVASLVFPTVREYSQHIMRKLALLLGRKS